LKLRQFKLPPLFSLPRVSLYLIQLTTPFGESWFHLPMSTHLHCMHFKLSIHLLSSEKSEMRNPHTLISTSLTNNNFIFLSFSPRLSHDTNYQNLHSTHTIQRITWGNQPWEAKLSIYQLIHELNNSPTTNIENSIKNPSPTKMHAWAS
jgi:hypothetical protein